MRRGALIFAGLCVLGLALASIADASSVSPASMDFGSQTIGTAGSAVTFTLTASPNFCNVYAAPNCASTTNYQTDTTALGAYPGATAISGDFLIHNDTCPSPLTSPPSPGPAFGPAGSCQFEVSFMPTAAGPLAKTLTFPDTSPQGSAGTLTLTGAGVAAMSVPASTTSNPTHRRCKHKKHHASAAKKKCKKKRR